MAYSEPAQRLGKKVSQGLFTLAKNGYTNLKDELEWLEDMARGYGVKVNTTSKVPAVKIYHIVASLWDDGQWEEIQYGNDIYDECFEDDWTLKPRYMRPRNTRRNVIKENCFPY